MKRRIVMSIGVFVVVAPGIAFVSPALRRQVYERYLFWPLREPVVVTHTLQATDGGTIILYLSGADGERFAVCVDGREFVEQENPTNGRLFIGGYPEGESAVLAAKRGFAEIELVRLLRVWLKEERRAAARRVEPKESWRRHGSAGTPPRPGCVEEFLRELGHPAD